MQQCHLQYMSYVFRKIFFTSLSSWNKLTPFHWGISSEKREQKYGALNFKTGKNLPVPLSSCALGTKRRSKSQVTCSRTHNSPSPQTPVFFTKWATLALGSSRMCRQNLVMSVPQRSGESGFWQWPDPPLPSHPVGQGIIFSNEK